jgi:hypothetical protein
MKLSIELVPSTSWFTNLRSILTAKEWDMTRGICYQRATFLCEICGGVGPEHPVECHEVWSYAQSGFLNIQKLERTIALCPSCHQVKHMGFAMTQGVHVLEKAATHFMNVNNFSPDETEFEIEKAFRIHHERSKRDWYLDVSWLQNKVWINGNKLQDRTRGLRMI